MAVRLILDEIAGVLEQKGRVEVRGFGAFSVFHRGSRKGRNPNTGKIIELPAKDVPHFRAGKELRERVNLSHAVAGPVIYPDAELEAMEA